MSICTLQDIYIRYVSELKIAQNIFFSPQHILTRIRYDKTLKMSLGATQEFGK